MNARFNFSLIMWFATLVFFELTVNSMFFFREGLKQKAHALAWLGAQSPTHRGTALYKKWNLPFDQYHGNTNELATTFVDN